MNIQDIFYHGIRDQIRRVLTTMGPERVEKGLTAFVDGASSWSSCFFARAYPDLELSAFDAEHQLMKTLGLRTTIPIRIVYCTFDGAGIVMTKQQLRDFIQATLTESDTETVNKFLATIDYSAAEIFSYASDSCAGPLD